MIKKWTKDDWPTEEQIQAMIASDPENPELTDEELANMRPFAEVFPELAENFRRAAGRPKAAQTKKAVSVRLDPDVLEKFRATGPGWQTRINAVLKAAKL
ncbi:MAG: BrnA antitoxin family protein [Gemmobacter sp.]